MKHRKICLVFVLMLTSVLLASCSSLLPQPQSAYDIAVENGFQGSEADWLASIRGDEGKSAYELYRDLFGYEGTEEQWLIDLRTGALISFKVTFDLDGGQAPEGFVSSITVRGGSFLDLKTPTKEGYTFLGWWTGDGDTDFAMTATTAVRSDLSLRAKWRSNVLSVRFLDKDGKLLKQETVPYGGAATAPEAPEVANFLFQKWDVDFSVVSEDLTVKAVYSPLYTLSFDTDGGTKIADTIYISGEVPAVPTDPQKGDLIFRGWYADKEFTVPYDFSAPITQNTTVYAYFSDMKPISNAEELMAIGNNSTGKFYLTNDISLGGATWTPIVGFAGEFDGRGYKIHNFIISETESAGFFTTNSGTIQNLTLADFVFTVSVVGKNIAFEAGALVGTNEGVIENCHITDAVATYHGYSGHGAFYSSFVGGLVGSNSGIILDSSTNIKIACCAESHADNGAYNSYTVSGGAELWVGGAVGKNSGTIINVTANTSIDATAKGSNGKNDYAYPRVFIGGLISINEGEVSLANSNISVTGSAENTGSGVIQEFHFGGFVYKNTGTVFQCFADGVYDVSNTTLYCVEVGGFVCMNENQVTDCYTTVTLKTASTRTGKQTDNKVGGFVATNKGTITTSYTSSNIESLAALGSFGGFVGSNESGAIVKNCVATGNVTYAAQTEGAGLFVGVVRDGSGPLFKNYYNTESKIMQGEADVTVDDENATKVYLTTLQSREFLVDTLGWNPEIWEIVDGQYPTLAANK